jgi:hypothetical protein
MNMERTSTKKSIKAGFLAFFFQIQKEENQINSQIAQGFSCFFYYLAQ